MLCFSFCQTLQQETNDLEKTFYNKAIIFSEQEEEEDPGWDDIEDLSSIDENKTRQQSGGGASKVDLWKRLSATEQEEDLSWDIEDDDDETVKA